MRQLQAFATGIAEAIEGEVVEVQEADLQFEHVFGASPDLLAGMSGDALLTMVRSSDEQGIDPGRALTMALGLAAHAHSLGEADRAVARAKSVRLLDAAFEVAPSMRTPEFEALRQVLVEAPTTH